MDMVKKHKPVAVSVPPGWKTPNHPAYSQMIQTAIQTMKEENGSTAEAIDAYIENNYHSLPYGHLNLFPHYFNKLLNAGQIQEIGSSSPRYIIDAPDPWLLPVKRRPGRPPNKKIKTEDKPLQVNPRLLPNKRGPGRPPKKKTESEDADNSLAPIKRGRGRPRKINTEILTVPSKTIPIGTTVNNNNILVLPELPKKRGPGRPPGKKPIIQNDESLVLPELPKKLVPVRPPRKKPIIQNDESLVLPELPKKLVPVRPPRKKPIIQNEPFVLPELPKKRGPGRPPRKQPIIPPPQVLPDQPM